MFDKKTGIYTCDICDKYVGPNDDFDVHEPVLRRKPWFAFFHKGCLK